MCRKSGIEHPSTARAFIAGTVLEEEGWENRLFKLEEEKRAKRPLCGVVSIDSLGRGDGIIVGLEGSVANRAVVQSHLHTLINTPNPVSLISSDSIMHP